MNRNVFICLVAPDVLHHHVKSISDSTAKNLHFRAPEIDTGDGYPFESQLRRCFVLILELHHVTTAVDIYSLGIVTLEVCGEIILDDERWKSV